MEYESENEAEIYSQISSPQAGLIFSPVLSSLHFNKINILFVMTLDTLSI